MAPDAAAAEREGRAKKRQFEAVRTLGRGTSGTVKLCRFKPTGALVALKSLVKAHTDGTGAESFWREVTALRTAGRHENLCGLLDAFETSTKYYLVLEYCSGGDLFNRLASGGVFTEAHAATSVATILNALHFLHSHGVVHRDLKPANLLMRDSSLNAALVLVDFGSSFVGTGVQASGGKDAMQTLAGTPYYLAPEIVRGKRYSSKCDLWSTGCIAYELLAGCTPFHYASSIQDLYKRIRRADFSFPPECGSDLARDFVCRLLDPDPRARPTALEALGHPWI
ncbi:aurora-2, an oncogenic serine threonine kinase, partial [Hyaloraphidium curvatum]